MVRLLNVNLKCALYDNIIQLYSWFIINLSLSLIISIELNNMSWSFIFPKSGQSNSIFMHTE